MLRIRRRHHRAHVSVTPDADAFSVGALNVRNERAAGFYGSLVNINAQDAIFCVLHHLVANGPGPRCERDKTADADRFSVEARMIVPATNG